jgi:hypothetical protein
VRAGAQAAVQHCPGQGLKAGKNLVLTIRMFLLNFKHGSV